MKSNFSKFAFLAILFLALISTGTAQTCGLRITDPTPTANGTYYATITVVYNHGGIYLVGTQTFYGFSANIVNPINLPWDVPIDTQANIYILRADVFDGNSTAANNNPVYSAWFNTDFYYNSPINVTAYFN